MAMIQDNIREIEQHISSICNDLGRNPQDVALIGVTKYTDEASISEAVKCGLIHVAESRVQDAAKKFEHLAGDLLKVKKHLIGHLQSNKAKQAVECFDMIQSVDSLKLAQVIDKQAGALNKTIEILLQVNISGEEQKYGLEPQSVFQCVKDVLQLKQLSLKGFMTMAPFTDDDNCVRQCFKDLRLLRDDIVAKLGVNQAKVFPYISMGMSQDYKIALEEGSNMIRIGSAIFG